MSIKHAYAHSDLSKITVCSVHVLCNTNKKLFDALIFH